MINEIVRKIINEQLNKSVSFGFSYQQFRCNKCGKFFDTEKGCLIHITKKHKKRHLSNSEPKGSKTNKDLTENQKENPKSASQLSEI